MGNQRIRRGSATLELVLVLPILLVTAMLTMDYGRFATRLIALNNAVRCGAYLGAYRPPDTTEVLWDAAVEQAIQDELATNPWFDSSLLTIGDPENFDVSGARYVRVQASYPFQTVIPWTLLTNYTNSRTLSHTVVMRSIR